MIRSKGFICLLAQGCTSIICYWQDEKPAYCVRCHDIQIIFTHMCKSNIIRYLVSWYSFCAKIHFKEFQTGIEKITTSFSIYRRLGPWNFLKVPCSWTVKGFYCSELGFRPTNHRMWVKMISLFKIKPYFAKYMYERMHIKLY